MAKLSMKKKTKSKKSLHGSVKRQTSQKKLKIRKSSNRSKKTGTKKTKKGGANLAGRIKSNMRKRRDSLQYYERLGPINILMYKMQKEQVTGDELKNFIDGHRGADLFINAEEKADPEEFTPIEFVFFVLMRRPMTAPDYQRCLDYINVLLNQNVELSDRLVKAATEQLRGGGAIRPSNNQQSFEEAIKEAARQLLIKKNR